MYKRGQTVNNDSPVLRIPMLSRPYNATKMNRSPELDVLRSTLHLCFGRRWIKSYE